MAITQSEYSAPYKEIGDIFSADEHNELKDVVNAKTDSVNAILIESDQTLDGHLTLNGFSAGSSDITGRLTLTDSDDQIRFISEHTGGNTSLNRDTFIMTKADSELDFYVYSVTDNSGKFYVKTDGSGWFANKLNADGRVTISHNQNGDDSKALVLSSGVAANSTPTDIVFSRENADVGQLRFSNSYDMTFSVRGNDNNLKRKIVIGSQTGTGTAAGVTLYDGDLETVALRTFASGISIPTRFDNSTYNNTGLFLSSNTSTGFAGGDSDEAGGSVWFKETADGRSGYSIEYFGDTQGDFTGDKLYINRFGGSSTTPIPVVSFPKTSSTAEFWGNIAGQFARQDGTIDTKVWFTNVGSGSNAKAEAIIQIDGTLVIGAGSSGTTVMNTVGNSGTNSVVAERLYLTSDTDMRFITNLNNGYGAKKEMILEAVSGALTVDGPVNATNFQFTSDITLKENIKPLNTGIDINFIEFNFKDDTTKRYGVSAQEVQKVLPELVTENGKGDLTVSMIDLLVLKIAQLEEKLNNLTK